MSGPWTQSDIFYSGFTVGLLWYYLSGSYWVSDQVIQWWVTHGVWKIWSCPQWCQVTQLMKRHHVTLNDLLCNSNSRVCSYVTALPIPYSFLKWRIRKEATRADLRSLAWSHLCVLERAAIPPHPLALDVLIAMHKTLQGVLFCGCLWTMCWSMPSSLCYFCQLNCRFT